MRLLRRLQRAAELLAHQQGKTGMMQKTLGIKEIKPLGCSLHPGTKLLRLLQVLQTTQTSA